MTDRPSEIVMPSRPASDRELDEGVVRSTLEEEFPALDVRRVEPLGSGWATDVYLVNEELVLRFPRNAEVAHWLDSDEAILTLVDARLGQDLAVPRPVLRGRGSTHFPHGFLGCELVAGVAADDPRAPPSEELVADLARALMLIHAVPVEATTEAGVGRLEDGRFHGTPCFLHNDFTPDNIMVHAATGRLSGIIDWGNAAIGDPARDFVGLVLWRGWPFTGAVLDAYGGAGDTGLEDRIRFHAQLQSVQWLADSVRRGADPELHLGWVRRAFGLPSGSEPE